MKSGPEDDLETLLETLEDCVKKARTGDVLGSGANGHARSLKRYLPHKVKGRRERASRVLEVDVLQPARSAGRAPE